MPAPRLKKVVDEVHAISARRGNGKVRVETWVDKTGNVVRYNLAYINHSIFAGDNGERYVTTASMAAITGIASGM